MHGIVFAAFRDFLVERVGQEGADEILSRRPPYRLSEAYADDEFTAFVEDGLARAGEPLPEFLEAFGEFTGRTTFPRLYPAFYDVAGDTLTFLLTIESRIHELIRATVPDASPPRLLVERRSPSAIAITYDSPRRLCSFLRGLVIGTATHFGESVDVREESCRLRGDAACVFVVEGARSV